MDLLDGSRKEHQRRVPSGRVLWLLIWAASLLSTIIIFDSSSTILQRNIVAAVSVSIGMYGLTEFAICGKRRIGALAIFNLGAALCLGLGGWEYSMLRDDGAISQQNLLNALIFSALLQASLNLFSANNPVHKDDVAIAPWTKETARFMHLSGALLLVVLFFVRDATSSGYAYAWRDGLTIGAVCVMALGAILDPDYKVLSWRTASVILALASYYTLFFVGFGRLRIVAISMTIAAVLSMRIPSYWWKVLTLAFLPLVMNMLGQHRREFTGEISTSGLESLTVPVFHMSEVLQAVNSGWPIQFGLTYLSWINRLLPSDWAFEAIPEPIGAYVVQIVRPDSYGSLYTTAITSFGEIYINFALVGLLLGVPILYWFVYLPQWALCKTMEGSEPGLLRASLFALAALAVGSIIDYVWGSSDIYIARLAIRSPLFIFLIASGYLHAEMDRRRVSSSYQVRR